MTASSDVLVQVFARTPVQGKVKTRLAEYVGEPQSLQIYQSLLNHSLRNYCAVEELRVELWTYGEDQQNFWQQTAKNLGLKHYQQVGEDLGERMYFAFQNGLRRASAVIAVGVDCPDLDSNYLRNAAEQLIHHDDLVVGPAEDGGYVLIGLRRLEKSIFSGISWGTSRVFNETLSRADNCGFRVKKLDKLRDIDRLEDWQWLKSRGWLSAD